MYRTQYQLFKKEAIYIAGPECFYTYGFEALNAMRRYAQAIGYGVTLPNDNPLDMENPNLQKRAHSIMADLAQDMNQTTVIISDLEAYRGAEADSGTVFEIGMAYAKGARSYGYTRDKRSLTTKNLGAVLKNGIVYDESKKKMPYHRLPFSPNVIGSTKIMEGNFYDCLHSLSVDIEEEEKFKVSRKKLIDNGSADTKTDKNLPLIFLAGIERYEENGEEIFKKMKQLCKDYGFDAVSPLDQTTGVQIVETDNPYAWAAKVFDNNQQQVRNCDIVIANLNDFRGYEISNDVAFECGMAYQLGKKLYGYMDNTDPLIMKIPHFGEELEYRDQSGFNVENFDYPANLMFSCTMKILEGKFEEILDKVIKDWKDTDSYDEISIVK